MKKLLVWGTGKASVLFRKIYEQIFSRYYDIVGYIDSNERNQGKLFYNQKVFLPAQICDIDWDMVLICTINKKYEEEMLTYLQKAGVERNKVACYSNCNGIGLMRDFFIEKYQNSKDPEVMQILQYIETHELTVFNMELERKEERYKVFRDSEEDDPYIWVDNKRMYYPKEYLNINSTPFLYGIYAEQSKNSPHLYVPDGVCIQRNSVIVDAGAREGNFALQYVENCERMYVIECEQEWCRALSKTFAPYSNKIIICKAFLGQYTDKDTQRIDDLIEETIDVLKMDIEGAEVSALRGAEKVLSKSHAYCAICAYHNRNDEREIKQLLREYGYVTGESKGYMLFGYDYHFYDSLDIRRGIVFGNK